MGSHARETVGEKIERCVAPRSHVGRLARRAEETLTARVEHINPDHADREVDDIAGAGVQRDHGSVQRPIVIHEEAGGRSERLVKGSEMTR